MDARFPFDPHHKAPGGSTLPATAAMIALALVVVWPSATRAERGEGTPTVEQILAEHGLEDVPSRCLSFSNLHELESRRRRWALAIHAIAEAHPGRIHEWISGAERPPEVALRETRHQRNCMIDALVEDAADGEPALPFVEGRPSASGTRAHAARYARSPDYRRLVIARFTESHYRGASAQSSIWRRKMDFYGRSFNRITETATRRCEGLEVGALWRPSRRAHRGCWRGELSVVERELQILEASSAPGLSRHHWGTDVDLFSLNPRNFVRGAPLAPVYDWMRAEALTYGFFQTYTGREAGRHGYMEERWHWSYYPIGQSLTDYATRHQSKLERSLNAQWDRVADWYNRRREKDTVYFRFIRREWRDFVFRITLPDFRSLSQERDRSRSELRRISLYYRILRTQAEVDTMVALDRTISELTSNLWTKLHREIEARMTSREGE